MKSSAGKKNDIFTGKEAISADLNKVVLLIYNGNTSYQALLYIKIRKPIT